MASGAVAEALPPYASTRRVEALDLGGATPPAPRQEVGRHLGRAGTGLRPPRPPGSQMSRPRAVDRR